VFQIRNQQMTVLDAYAMRRYEDRVVRKIARAFPPRYKRDGEEATRRFVQAGIRKADGYGIIEDDDVERFILVLAERGMDFEKDPGMDECRKILESKELPADAKVALVCRRLPPAY
jgi:hypothetical protein